jgi:flavin-binding protein dodecin
LQPNRPTAVENTTMNGLPGYFGRSETRRFWALRHRRGAMSIVRSIEVIAQSPNGFDDACKEAIREASKTLRGINSFWIKNAECVVENDQITMYRVNGKISFLVEDGR